MIVAATALPVAARSVAEKLGIPYVFAALRAARAVVLDARRHHHRRITWTGTATTNDNSEIWAQNADGERF